MTMYSLKNEGKQTNIKTKKINLNNLLKHASYKCHVSF